MRGRGRQGASKARRLHTFSYRHGKRPSGWPPGGSPKKGVNKEYKDFFPNLSVKNRVLKLRFLAFSQGPGGFREVREADRNHFHLMEEFSQVKITKQRNIKIC